MESLLRQIHVAVAVHDVMPLAKALKAKVCVGKRERERERESDRERERERESETGREGERESWRERARLLASGESAKRQGAPCSSND